MARTLADAQADLDLWIACERSIASGAQSYTIGGRSLTRASLAEVHRIRLGYQREVDTLTAGRSAGPRVRGVIPRDL